MNDSFSNNHPRATKALNIVIKTLHGLEEVLADEIRELGGLNVEIGRRVVSCKGDLEFLYKANLQLRCAMKILVPLFEFQANNEDELYQNVKNFDWSDYISIDQTYAIEAF